MARAGRSRSGSRPRRRARPRPRTPPLAAHAGRRQALYAEQFTALLADQTGVDPAVDVRPRLVISAILGVMNTAWAAWAADRSRDLSELVDEAHDMLDAGFAEALQDLG